MVAPRNQTNMKQNIIITSLLLAAATFGLAAAARADDPRPVPPVPASGAMGLLGQNYAGLTYRYIDLGNTSSPGDDFRFEFNQTLNAGLDGLFALDWAQNVSAARQQAVTAGLRAFGTAYTWGKPYAEAAAGYSWERVAGVKDNSLIWLVAVGAEFQVAPAVTVTPFVKYQGTPSLAQRDKWDFGVKANYWVDSQWAVTVGLDRDDHQNTGFMAGTNFRF